MGTVSQTFETGYDAAIPRASRRDARLAELGEYFTANYPSLRRFAFYLTGNWETADDLVQEAFLRVYRAGGKAQREGIMTYCRHAIVSINHSRLRRLATEHRLLPRLLSPDAGDPNDDGTRDAMQAALLRLSPRQRASIALRYYEQLSEAEIAACLGIGEGSVRRHIGRGLAALRTTFDRSQP